MDQTIRDDREMIRQLRKQLALGMVATQTSEQQEADGRRGTIVRFNSCGEKETIHTSGTTDIETPPGRFFFED